MRSNRSFRKTAMNRLPKPFLIIILICCLIEAVILAATVTVMPGARQAAYILGGFWSQMLSYGGYYPGQGTLMFVTYGFLHGGIGHLAMNMLSLWAIVREMERLLTVRQMLWIYGIGQISGAVLFGILAPQETAPMVGASGAIFGLAGGLIGAAFMWRKARRLPMKPLIRAVLLIGGLNLGLTFLAPDIAWQAHLGGVLAGLVMGMAMTRRR